jgi:hypothetical protein
MHALLSQQFMSETRKNTYFRMMTRWAQELYYYINDLFHRSLSARAKLLHLPRIAVISPPDGLPACLNPTVPLKAWEGWRRTEQRETVWKTFVFLKTPDFQENVC